MEKNSKDGQKHNKKKTGIFLRIFLPMVLLVILQLIAFLLISVFSGEFSYVKDYANDVLIEKTKNRTNYVESQLQQKTALVSETATEIDSIIADILQEENATIDDIATNKELNNKIIEQTSDNLISLLRRDLVNDAYIILDTKDLYDNDAKACMVIRDYDPNNNSINSNSDLLVEVGSSSIANTFGAALDSEWACNLTIDDTETFDFYNKTIATARENPDANLSDLGYWSTLSSLSRSTDPSLKYTVPLIDKEGNVYGVVGIGLLAKSIIKNIPSNDFLSESACYVLCADTNLNGEYSIVLHSGAIFSRLVDNTETISKHHTASKDNKEILEFNYSNDVETIGIVKNISLYNQSSPYYDEDWALVCVADKKSVIAIYTMLVKTFVISSLISAVIGFIIVIIISKSITKPIYNVIDTLDTNNQYDGIIKFDATDISEIDRLTTAITKLQINVKEYSSKVSKIISMVDVGIGVFMYDDTNNSVFVGRSLTELLHFKELPKEDIYIPLEEFIKNVSKVDYSGEVIRTIIRLIDDKSSNNTNVTKTFNVKEVINTKWFKLTINKEGTNIIGVIQDVTSVILEKKKIEYERDYDTTTGLLNRRAYYKRVEEKFNHPEDLKVSAFMMWDLDNLKYINDTYGHDFGDDYIKTAANVFKQFKDYGGVVCRMSGDEFNMLLTGFDSKEEILEVVDCVRNNLLKSYCLLPDGTHFKIRASSGIAFYPYDSQSYDMLMKYADFAMYTIKHSTKGAMAQFDMSTYNKDSILITGIEEMNRVIDESSIKYAYQIIMDVKDGEVYGYEALMRPQSTIFKSPLELIRIAKTCAKLYEIERLTWLEAIKPFHEAIQNGTIKKDTKVFVNSISNCIISKKDVTTVETNYSDILSNIVMEILESEQANSDYIKAKQETIKKWHSMIALDDFGSGYNSEYTLITLNPNVIKIDRSIISGCDNDISRKNIIASLTQISKQRGVLVLAEGVETLQELTTVMECGVDLVQGYFVSRPVFEFTDVPDYVKQTVNNINRAIKDN